MVVIILGFSFYVFPLSAKIDTKGGTVKAIKGILGSVARILDGHSKVLRGL